MNSHKFLFIYLSLSFFFHSCMAQENYATNKVKECINNYVEKKDKTFGYVRNQSLEETFKIFENFLLEKDLLKQIDKKNYLNLIEKIVQSPKDYKEIYSHVHDSSIYPDLTYIMNPPLMLGQCQDYVLVTEKNEYTSTLNTQHKIMQGVIQSNYQDIGRIKELFYNTPEEDFKNLMFRIPFIYIVTMNLEISEEPRNK